MDPRLKIDGYLAAAVFSFMRLARVFNSKVNFFLLQANASPEVRNLIYYQMTFLSTPHLYLMSGGNFGDDSCTGTLVVICVMIWVMREVLLVVRKMLGSMARLW